jgi:hypothetical protein
VADAVREITDRERTVNAEAPEYAEAEGHELAAGCSSISIRATV